MIWDKRVTVCERRCESGTTSCWREHIAVDHTPFVSTWRGAQMILGVTTLSPRSQSSCLIGAPFFHSLLDVCVIIVMVLGKGVAAHKACGKDRATTRVVRVPVGLPAKRNHTQLTLSVFLYV
jgi:hypothetical protein